MPLVNDAVWISGRAQRVRESLRNPLFYLKFYLPHHFNKPFGKFHVELAPTFLEVAKSGSSMRENVEGPRSVAKSTMFSVGLPTYVITLWEFCLKHFVVDIGDTYGQAVTNVETVRYELETNERIIGDFGEFKTEFWSTERIVAAGRSRVLSDLGSLSTDKDEEKPPARLIAKNEKWDGTLLMALGTSMKIRGRKFRQYRPDLMVIDDPENDEQVRSPEQRRKNRAWFYSAVLPAGSVDGYSVMLLGTALHEECLVEHVRTKDLRFRSRVYRFVESWPDDMKLWDKCRKIFIDLNRGDHRISDAKKFYLKHRKEMDKGFKLIQNWATDIGQETPYFDTMILFWTNPEAFWKERQNDPRRASDRPYDSSTFKKFNKKNIDRKKLVRVICGMDPAEGAKPGQMKKGKQDYCAIAIAGVDAKKYRYMLDMIVSKASAEDEIDNLLSLCKKWEVKDIFLEINMYKGLATIIRNKAEEKEMLVRVQGITQLKNKELRISAMQPDVNSGWILFEENLPPEVWEQFDGFMAGGAYDDAPDVTELVCNILGRPPIGRVLGDFADEIKRVTEDARIAITKKKTIIPICEDQYPYDGRNIHSERMSRLLTYCDRFKACQGCPIAKFLKWEGPIETQFKEVEA